MIKNYIRFLFVFATVLTINAQKSKITIDKKLATTDSIKSIILNDTIKIDTVSFWKTYKEKARASYYAGQFHGRRTASGARFDMYKLTAAHKTLPFGTKLKITNIENKKSVIVVINDRGPFIKFREIDLSKKAFMDIATHSKIGLLTVKIEIMK